MYGARLLEGCAALSPARTFCTCPQSGCGWNGRRRPGCRSSRVTDSRAPSDSDRLGRRGALLNRRPRTARPVEDFLDDGRVRIGRSLPAAWKLTSTSTLEKARIRSLRRAASTTICVSDRAQASRTFCGVAFDSVSSGPGATIRQGSALSSADGPPPSRITLWARSRSTSRCCWRSFCCSPPAQLAAPAPDARTTQSSAVQVGKTRAPRSNRSLLPACCRRFRPSMWPPSLGITRRAPQTSPCARSPCSARESNSSGGFRICAASARAGSIRTRTVTWLVDPSICSSRVGGNAEPAAARVS